MSFRFSETDIHVLIAETCNESLKAAPEATLQIPRIPDFLLGQLFISQDIFSGSHNTKIN